MDAPREKGGGIAGISIAMAITNAMTVDVEDYFHVSAFESQIDRADWGSIPCRLPHSLNVILELFDQHGVKATFFTLGWVADRYPQLIRELVDQGHELASHGWSHVRVTQQGPDVFRDDVMRTKRLLEDIGGCEVRGYRAASYSINRGNYWAHDILAETGYRYSSSVFPISHDLYGIPDAPRFGFRPNQGALIEFPVTTVRLNEKNWPCSGGGWFRLLPYAITRWALRRVNSQDREAAIFYFHPWELDPGQPRQRGLPLKTRFRHYLNLRRTNKRLERLLTDFAWGRMDETLYLPYLRRHGAGA